MRRGIVVPACGAWCRTPVTLPPRRLSSHAPLDAPLQGQASDGACHEGADDTLTRAIDSIESGVSPFAHQGTHGTDQAGLAEAFAVVASSPPQGELSPEQHRAWCREGAFWLAWRTWRHEGRAAAAEAILLQAVQCLYPSGPFALHGAGPDSIDMLHAWRCLHLLVDILVSQERDKEAVPHLRRAALDPVTEVPQGGPLAGLSRMLALHYITQCAAALVRLREFDEAAALLGDVAEAVLQGGGLDAVVQHAAADAALQSLSSVPGVKQGLVGFFRDTVGQYAAPAVHAAELGLLELLRSVSYEARLLPQALQAAQLHHSKTLAHLADSEQDDSLVELLLMELAEGSTALADLRPRCSEFHDPTRADVRWLEAVLSKDDARLDASSHVMAVRVLKAHSGLYDELCLGLELDSQQQEAIRDLMSQQEGHGGVPVDSSDDVPEESDDTEVTAGTHGAPDDSDDTDDAYGAPEESDGANLAGRLRTPPEARGPIEPQVKGHLGIAEEGATVAVPVEVLRSLQQQVSALQRQIDGLLKAGSA